MRIRLVPGAPSIADMRFAATLEFLRAIDYEFPAWAEEYMTRMETTLGEGEVEILMLPMFEGG